MFTDGEIKHADLLCCRNLKLCPRQGLGFVCQGLVLMGVDSFDGQEHRAGRRPWAPFHGRTCSGSRLSGFATDFSEGSEIPTVWIPGWTRMEEGLAVEKLWFLFSTFIASDAETVQRQDPSFRAGLDLGLVQTLCLMIL